jgi:hypothetical protein
VVSTAAFVDANHAGCCLRHCLHSGILIFVNRAPIIWNLEEADDSKKSTFGSKSIAMRQ